jgi:hypothetical protein
MIISDPVSRSSTRPDPTRFQTSESPPLDFIHLSLAVI